ncbi:MAG: acyloxyacyl hydrolase [Methylococcales bacterium]
MKFNLTLIGMVWAIFAQGIAMADPQQSSGQPYGYGTMYALFQLGYGSGFTIGNSGRADAKDVRYLATFPSFGIGISDSFGNDSWYRGNIDFVTEGEFITFLGPGEGHSAGLAVLLRYNFLSLAKFVPYAEVGVGAGYLESNLTRQSDGAVFYPQGAVGMNYFISDNWALSLSYRYHHISNKGIRKPNTGINTNVGLIGVEYHFD